MQPLSRNERIFDAFSRPSADLPFHERLDAAARGRVTDVMEINRLMAEVSVRAARDGRRPVGFHQDSFFGGMLARQYGGALQVEHGPGGTTFTLQLPQLPGVPRQARTDASPSRPARRDGFDPRQVEAAREASLAVQEDAFDRAFRRIHQSSIDAFARVIKRLWERPPENMPPGGIDREALDVRDGAVTYKLPALVLVDLLPQLCEHGHRDAISVFDEAYQKPMPGGRRMERYPSPIIEIRAALLSAHGDDATGLRATLPALAARLANHIEAGTMPSLSEERRLAHLLLRAGHQIQGHVLAGTFKHAYKDVNLD